MKNYSYKPTDENALQLLKSDVIGRTQEIRQFMMLLTNMEDDCYSIALNGEWGSGKTFFIKQIKLLLDAQNPYSSMDDESRQTVLRTVNSQFTIPESYTTVYYDAWINDNHNDPILSLIYAIISNNHNELTPEKSRSLSDVVAALASALSGHDISTLLQQLKGSDTFGDLNSENNTHHLVKDFINQLIQEHGNRLIFFIDELDRCKPDYAIRFLERIKHYFDDDRVTFVFAVSLSQLQSTVKSYYGLEYNATRYLDKFFDLRISLRSIDLDAFISHQLNMGQNYIFDVVSIESAKYFNFSLREIERYGRMMKIAGSAIRKHSGGFSEENAKIFALGYIVPIMLALQMYDIELYNKFMMGLEPAPMVNILLRPNVHIQIKYLLFPQETYDEEKQIINRSGGQKPISLSDRLKEVYSVLFSRPLERGRRDICIGNMTFEYSTRRGIEEIASMLSPLSEYQFE